METIGNFLRENWMELLLGLAGLVASGFVIRMFWHRQSGSSNYVDQRNVRTRGDVVGRDKVVGRDEAPRP
jgi:hypothetical protein